MGTFKPSRESSGISMADRRPEEAAVGVLVILLVGISSRWGGGLATSRAIRDTGELVIDNQQHATNQLLRTLEDDKPYNQSGLLWYVEALCGISQPQGLGGERQVKLDSRGMKRGS